jgi:hypothetical protein
MANEFKIKNGLVVSGSADFEQDLTVRGTITADQLIISIVSSSVLFESGSTQFGNSIEDTHKITGSLLMTGSIDLNGQPVETGRLAESTFSTYSGATNTRITNLETSTGSINGYTSSTNLRLTSIETSTGSLNTYSASNTTNIDAIHTSTGSLNTYTSSNTTNINAIHTSTGSLNSYTSSNTTNVNAIHTSTASLNSFTSSAGSRLDSIEGISGSIASLNIYTGSNNIVIGTLQTATSSINSFTSSASSRLTSIEGVTGSIASLNIYTGSNNIVIGTLQTASSSLNSYTSSNTTNVNAIHTSTASLNTYTSSNTTNINAIHTSTSSLNSFTSSIDTTIKNKLNSDSVISSSIQVVASLPTGTVSGSSQVLNGSGVWSGSAQLPAGTVSGSSQVLNGSGVWSGSAQLPSGIVSSSTQVTNYGFATTGSNTFKSNQTISGSVIITENLTVFGSSSITYVTSSQLRVEDNIITVNTASPGSRFGGLEVHDSGSVGIATGSLLWDSVNNRWVYQNSSEASYGGGVLLSGPRSSGSLGSELTLTSGRVAKSAGGDHLNDSNITDNGTVVSVNSNTEITGSLIITGGNKLTINGPGGDEGGEILLSKASTNTTLSGDGVTIDIWQNRLRIFEQGGSNRGAYLDITTLGNSVATNLMGTAQTASFVEYSNVANKPTLVSGSSQIIFSGITGVPSGLVSGSSQVLNGSGVWSGSAQLPSGVVSGSSQITFLSISSIPSGLVSGSSQVLAGTGIWSGSAQLPSGVVSGSSQVLNGSGVWSGSAQLPSGVVSGSSQVLAGTTIHSGAFFNGISVVSGSGQISFNGITDKPSLVSGSSQITYGSLTGIPSGIVSGSSQVLSGTGIWSGSAQLPSGVVSGSSQISFGSISGIPSGLVSGSSQISFGSISSIPSGLVSGSSQITLSSTTGFGSYLNQAVLTSSSPSFAAVSATTFTGALNGNATTATTAGALTSMNISQFTNNSGYITGIAFSSVSSKPTTLSGYGITDSLYQDRATINVNSFNATGLYRGSTSGWSNRPTSVHNGGALLTIDTHPGDYHSQLFFDTGGDRLYFRNANAASWGSWLTIYHSGNLTNLNQLTNGPGYITSYTETDTLATVTARGASTSTALTLSGNLTASAYVVIGGGYGNNAYSAVDSTRLLFGGGDSDAIGNYYIGTNKEDYGGNYTKLDLRWHTGIRMGAQAGYGGIRFYNSEDLGSVLFSIGTGDGNVRSHTNLIPSANNSYNLGSTTLGWANVYTNDLHLSNMNKPEGNDIDGTSGNWTIQEGAENLYIINNNNGKKFKISLEEIK